MNSRPFTGRLRRSRATASATRLAAVLLIPVPATARRPAVPLICWLAVAPGLAWAVVRLVGLDRGPLVQALAFTPYVAGWSLLALTLTLALRCRWPAVAASVAALALLGAVVPRALPDRQPATRGPELRVLTANLLAGDADAATLVELVRRHRVDVLTVQEFTPAARDALDRAGLADLLPHRQLNPEVGTTGSGLYARFSLTAGGFRRNAGFAFTQAYATVAVPGAPPLRVESAHPAAPWSAGVVGEWRTDLAGQPRATPDGQPGILAGDFNATLDHSRCVPYWPAATSTPPTRSGRGWWARGGRTTAIPSHR